MQKNQLFYLFFRAKPALALHALGNTGREWYASLLAKEVDCTFPHMLKILSGFKQEGLVEFSSGGRKKVITLTAKGKELSAAVGKVLALCGGA